MTNKEAIEFLKNMINREAIGFVCPEREGDVAIWQYHVEALQMAISALQAQEAKAQLSAEGTTSDLISRQDAIEVIEEMQMPIMRSMFPEEQFVFKGMSEALSAIKDLPSAQPEIEERKEESAQNVPKEDLISRKEAIDALGERPMVWTDDDQYALGERTQYDMNRLAIETLPTAQPEVLACGEGVLNAQPEIVRCKDCENWIPGYITDNDDFIPPKCGKYQQMVGHSSNDYCSFAERRTDE